MGFERENVPITSIRRALTDLDERHAKVLRKHEEDQKKGDYRSPCCRYSLLPPADQNGQYQFWPNRR